ncbi:NAD+ synthase [Parasutterella excrementihominis]|uniref:NAD+ synthase n=1 Tax=Parasutterella excrementihominis TaxID=487175 RepID=UPI0026670173|nr:NAD+ synthase [Parasutterella excrementihominis]
MIEKVVVSMAQLNQTAGDLEGNFKRIAEAAEKAKHSDILVTPELSLCGYPPEDLLFLDSFLEDCAKKLNELVEYSTRFPKLHILAGYPLKEAGRLYNVVSVILNGKILLTYRKKNLPNYGVFDEERYFTPGGEDVCTFDVGDTRFGVNICEDIWFPEAPSQAKEQGAQVLLIANASPFEEGKEEQRLNMVRRHVNAIGMDACYVNMCGAQDEIVFDGETFACSADEVLARAPHMKESLLSVEVRKGRICRGEDSQPLSDWAVLYEALVVSMRDYINKNGFKGVVLGLSGGVDSALVLKIAVDAVGNDKVLAVMMPSVYTSSLSRGDAAKLASRLGVRLETISIQGGYTAFEFMLAKQFNGMPHDVTEENLQARIRGVILMAISNKFGSMVATTGNKSEMAVGYSTLYGDLAGGFAVIKDVYKTQVYALCRWINECSKENPVFPETILTRAPSAELRENQKDQDSLPDYSVLDEILRRFIEDREGPEEIVAAGFDRAVVDKVLRMVSRAEYKRRQSPIGPKVTKVAFGRDWRFPVTNKYRL